MNSTLNSKIDLSKENSSSLESIDPKVLINWKESGKKAFWIGLGFIGALVVFNLIIFSVDPNGL